MSEHRCKRCAKYVSEEQGAFLSSDRGFEGYFCGWDCFNAWKYGESENQQGRIAQQDFNRLNEKVYATLEWTNVKDELPKVAQEENYHPGQRDSFLVACSEGVGKGLYGFGYRRVVAEWLHHEQQWHFGGQDITELVTHWRPIPGLPIQAKPKSAEVGHCENCKHWTAPFHGEEFGVCEVLTYSSSPYLGSTSLAKSGEMFRTNKHFGCTEFQEPDA